MGSFITSTVHETDVYFVIQRGVRVAAATEEEIDWIDSSGKYYGEHNEITALTERDRMREIFGDANVRVVRRDTTVIETPVEGPTATGEQDVVKALRSCIEALRKIDMANCALTEGCGDLLYDNPEPLAREMNIATAQGQRTYLEAARILKTFSQDQ